MYEEILHLLLNFLSFLYCLKNVVQLVQADVSTFFLWLVVYFSQT